MRRYRIKYKADFEDAMSTEICITGSADLVVFLSILNRNRYVILSVKLMEDTTYENNGSV